MKRLVLAAFLVMGVATIMTVGEARTTSSAAPYQEGQPLFLDFVAQYDLVPATNIQLGFQNPVRIRNINYPWVLVSPVNAPRQGTTEIWVNFHFISVITKHR